jgi:tetratricopeptide (TPR) repeat protein
MAANPEDQRAPYYLGNLLYDRRRHEEAIRLWEIATGFDPEFPVTWRNLGFGYYNVLHDEQRARHAFARARELAPNDARILYEQDQLLKRIGEPLDSRLATLEANSHLVKQRDDLSVEIASLYNSLERPEQALDVLQTRHFQPWEGGEGLVLAQYVRANLALGQQALKDGLAVEAMQFFQAAGQPPQTLSEAQHLLANQSAIAYWLGVGCEALRDHAGAVKHLERAANTIGDFQQMQVQTISESTYWSALALAQLGRDEEARALFQAILDFALQLNLQTPKIDYFATSLPAMLLFDEDLKRRQTITANFLQAQALLGLGERERGTELLRTVLAQDMSHVGAIDLIKT